jgi:predicted nuclease with TOPRIM domain
MKLPEQLPSDPDEIERLYNAYAQADDDFDEAEFQRLMDARLAVWGIDPKQMTPDQIFGAMAESMNSMLLSLQAAMADAPDDLASEQVGEIIKAAEELRKQIDSAMQAATENPADESPPDVSASAGN